MAKWSSIDESELIGFESTSVPGATNCILSKENESLFFWENVKKTAFSSCAEKMVIKLGPLRSKQCQWSLHLFRLWLNEEFKLIHYNKEFFKRNLSISCLLILKSTFLCFISLSRVFSIKCFNKRHLFSKGINFFFFRLDKLYLSDVFPLLTNYDSKS